VIAPAAAKLVLAAREIDAGLEGNSASMMTIVQLSC
jgi:hypothetical protein